MIAYMEFHLISLEQDAEKFQHMLDSFQGDLDSDEYEELEITDIVNTGEIHNTQHLLSVAHDILRKNNERVAKCLTHTHKV